MWIDDMRSNVEQVRPDEWSSAGKQTQQLDWLRAGAPRRRAGRQSAMGTALLITGTFLLMIRFVSGAGWLRDMMAPYQFLPSVGEIQAGLILLTIGSSLLWSAFAFRFYLLLIPGCVVAGLSGGVTFASTTNGASVLWGLALGFTLLYLLGVHRWHLRAPWHMWPLVPAVTLFAVGTLIVMTSLISVPAGLFHWSPLLLIALGLYLYLWGGPRERSET